MTLTAAYIGTRGECEDALRMIPTEGAWDGKGVVHGKLVGKPRWVPSPLKRGRWRVEQDIEVP